MNYCVCKKIWSRKGYQSFSQSFITTKNVGGGHVIDMTSMTKNIEKFVRHFRQNVNVQTVWFDKFYLSIQKTTSFVYYMTKSATNNATLPYNNRLKGRSTSWDQMTYLTIINTHHNVMTFKKITVTAKRLTSTSPSSHTITNTLQSRRRRHLFTPLHQSLLLHFKCVSLLAKVRDARQVELSNK